MFRTGRDRVNIDNGSPLATPKPKPLADRRQRQKPKPTPKFAATTNKPATALRKQSNDNDDHQRTMKLSAVTLSLVTVATACSAFALNPGVAGVRSSSAAGGRGAVSPAFVRGPDLAPPSSSSTALQASSTAVAASSSTSDSLAVPRGGGLSGLDVPLLVYFALWYLGNYYYNITNKLALKATGGASGFPMTISALQLGIGSLYGIFLWLAPDARDKPKITMDDVSFSFVFIGSSSFDVRERGARRGLVAGPSGAKADALRSSSPASTGELRSPGGRIVREDLDLRDGLRIFFDPRPARPLRKTFRSVDFENLGVPIACSCNDGRLALFPNAPMIA
ncbi:hypothetical protein ACHAWF_002762 [Thalassiosira exigua]